MINHVPLLKEESTVVPVVVIQSAEVVFVVGLAAREVDIESVMN